MTGPTNTTPAHFSTPGNAHVTGAYFRPKEFHNLHVFKNSWRIHTEVPFLCHACDRRLGMGRRGVMHSIVRENTSRGGAFPDPGFSQRTAYAAAEANTKRSGADSAELD
ncbi:hypothetical protein DPEC_G00276570 [Dallia pectoralis]|uniref:Uncharacterized protein n=1 Tax=Dallia pectoralis TaxID=75939 RepID=A0ACC2FLX5_DALPE|nr:hypothetical protein DPEC_G00276570 [Dallia pectoralis]